MFFADAGRSAPRTGFVSELQGYGPIIPHTARTVAGKAAHWNTVRVDPPSGVVLSVGRYRPSEQIRRTLTVRDETCRFPGCTTPTSRCDLDHTIDAQYGGPTSTTNLAFLCRNHHRLKHHTGWKVTQHGDGTLTWRTPTGRIKTEPPPSRVRFAPITPTRETPPPF